MKEISCYRVLSELSQAIGDRTIAFGLGSGEMAVDRIRTLIVDDHVIVRQGLRALLFEVDELEVVGEAGDGLEALHESACLEPDVVLMDLLMPGMDGIETTAAIRARQPTCASWRRFPGDLRSASKCRTISANS